jgi:hypothetical protein
VKLLSITPFKERSLRRARYGPVCVRDKHCSFRPQTLYFMICHCPPLAPAPSSSPPPVPSLSPALLLLISALAAWLLSSTRATSQQHQQTLAAGHFSFTLSAPEPALPLPSSSVPRSELGVVCLGAPPETASNFQFSPCFAEVYLESNTKISSSNAFIFSCCTYLRDISTEPF